MIFLPFANSQYLRVVVMGRVYQAGGIYQRQASNTNLTSQKMAFFDKRRSFDRRRRLDYLPYFSVILVNSCYYTVVTSFQILCFVLNFQFPFPPAPSPLPVSRFSNIPILNYRLPSNTIATGSLGLSSPTVNTMTSIMARAYIS